MNKEKHMTDIERLVRQMGFTANYKGYGYLVEGIGLALMDPERLLFITKGIYLEIALHHSNTAGNVERSIRTAVNAVWKREPELFRKVIGYPFPDRPSVSQLIGSITGYLMESKR